MQKDSELRNINLLFLIVVVLQAANLFFLWLPQYVRLLLNESLFVFLPAYLYLRFTRQSVRPRVSWRWPGSLAALLSLLVGFGLYPISAASAGLLQQLLGYTNLSAPADAIPTNLTMALLAVLAYAIMAPFCEEFLFRGVIQPVYAQHGPRRAIVWVGFLFIIFHLALLQGLSIIPISLALGYVFYRTRSLPASILTHFGANLLAALVITEGVFNLALTPILFTTPLIFGGLMVALLALLVLSRLPLGPPPVQQAVGAHQEAAFIRPSRLATFWPLLLVGVIYLTMTGLEVFHARSPVQAEPSTLQADPLTLEAYHWPSPHTWHYEISNVVGDVVGDGECRLTPLGAAVEIICYSQVIAYQVTIDQSTWMSSGGELVDLLRWEASDGRPLSGESTMILEDGQFHLITGWEAHPAGIDLRLSLTGQPDSSEFVPATATPLAKDPALLLVPDKTWPWQLAGMKLEMEEMGEVVRFNPHTWRPQTSDSGPLWESQLVRVEAWEEVSTPAGSYDALKVSLGDRQSVWYDLDNGLTPVKFFNGVETWSLITTK